MPLDPVGDDTSPAALLAAYDRMPVPSDREPFLAAAGELVASGDLMVPRGFVAERLLPDSALRRPTSLAFGPDGRLAVSFQAGEIVSVDVSGPTGRDVRTIATGFELTLGLLWIDEALYVSADGTVWRLRPGAPREAVVEGIPTAQHSTDGMALGPDGRIYLGVGSTCNACAERDQRNGAVVRFSPDGGEVEIFARGLRNPYDLAFHPDDGSLWATDNGRDDLGAQVPDELNLVQERKHYGWPDCYGKGRGANCGGTVGAIVELESNSSSDGIAFYTGSSFPEEYRQNMFVAQWGSFRRDRGRKLVRIVAVKREGRYDARLADFATGFDTPIDVVVGPRDGALYVADHGRGTIYRIRWSG
jgi:glucose/arabinose dehydrogenase